MQLARHRHDTSRIFKTTQYRSSGDRPSSTCCDFKASLPSWKARDAGVKNVVERVWRSFEYECMFLHTFDVCRGWGSNRVVGRLRRPSPTALGMGILNPSKSSTWRLEKPVKRSLRAHETQFSTHPCGRRSGFEDSLKQSVAVSKNFTTCGGKTA